MGAIRMKAAVQAWLINWKHSEIDDYTFHELKQMGASTLERELKKDKANLRRRLNTGTVPGKSKMKTLIPIRELGVMPTVPGHCEIDCVAHCGGSLSGSSHDAPPNWINRLMSAAAPLVDNMRPNH